MTAAPGPQQPDEVRCNRGHTPSEHASADGEWVCPAAPSAQPDECDRCGLPKSAPLHGNPFGVGHPFTPAQPVHDTEEGRR